MSENMISKRIESQMVLKGISKKELETYLGISYPGLRLKLMGQNSWKDTEIIQLSRLLEVSTDYLLKGE